MRRLREKLRSRTGASILFAILVFMLCILAGTAALTAAAAASGRYTHLEADQRSYLAVSSAAKLLRDEFQGREITSKKVTTTVTKTDEDGNVTEDAPVTIDHHFTDSEGNELDEGVLKLLVDYFDTVVKGETEDSFTVNLTVDGPDEDDSDMVTAVLTANTGYQVTVELYAGSADKKIYDTVVNVPAAVKKHSETKTEEETDESTGDTTRTVTVTEYLTVTWQESAPIVVGEGDTT